MRSCLIAVFIGLIPRVIISQGVVGARFNAYRPATAQITINNFILNDIVNCRIKRAGQFTSTTSNAVIQITNSYFAARLLVNSVHQASQNAGCFLAMGAADGIESVSLHVINNSNSTLIMIPLPAVLKRAGQLAKAAAVAKRSIVI